VSEFIKSLFSTEAILATDGGTADGSAISEPLEAARFSARINAQAAAPLAQAQGDGQNHSRHQAAPPVTLGLRGKSPAARAAARIS
jgi:hypothetical protein